MAFYELLINAPVALSVSFALGLYLVVRVVQLYLQWSYQYRCLSKLPGASDADVFAFVSELLAVGPGEGSFAFMRHILPIFPKMTHVFMGPFQVVVGLTHHVTIKEILKTSDPKPLKFGGYFASLPWLGDGLLTSGGRKWARNRRLLSPAFHFDILKPYTVINNRAATTLATKIESFSSKGEFFDLFPLVSLCTLEIILKCAFSFDEDVQTQGENNEYVKAVKTLSETLVYRSMRPWLHPDLLFALSPTGRRFRRCCNLVHNIADDVIRRRRQTLANKEPVPSKRALDFLDILLTAKDEDGKGLTDREIRQEVDTFLFAGHDTTASGISWMLYTMAQYPQWQRRCQEEIDSIMDARDSQDILWEDLPKFSVLTACLKESLRLHTPVPIISRETSKDMYIDGYFVPKGTSIDITLYGLMHHEQIWKDPMKYDPERFMDDNPSRDPFAFIPFSAGPRNCIGQHFAMHEMKVVISQILRRYNLSIDNDRPAKHLFSVVMKTESGMFVKAEPRENRIV